MVTSAQITFQQIKNKSEYQLRKSVHGYHAVDEIFANWAQDISVYQSLFRDYPWLQDKKVLLINDYKKNCLFLVHAVVSRV